MPSLCLRGLRPPSLPARPARPPQELEFWRERQAVLQELQACSQSPASPARLCGPLALVPAAFSPTAAGPASLQAQQVIRRC